MPKAVQAILWAFLILRAVAAADASPPCGEERGCAASPDDASLLQVQQERAHLENSTAISGLLKSKDQKKSVKEAPGEDGAKAAKSVPKEQATHARRAVVEKIMDARGEETNSQDLHLSPQDELPFIYPGKYGRFRYYMHRIRPQHMAHNASHQSMHQNIWRHVVGTVGACVATFSINFIDVVWIMPFIVDKVDGTWNATFFMAMSQILATVSIIIFAIKGTMEAHNHNTGMERSLDLATAILLGLYAGYLFFEAHFYSHAPASLENASEESGESGEGGKDVAEGSYGRRQFMILCAVGGLDQVAVYIPVLTTQVLNAVELELGVLASTLISVAMCFCLGKSETLKAVVEAIPLWLIVLVLGAASFVQFLTAD